MKTKIFFLLILFFLSIKTFAQNPRSNTLLNSGISEIPPEQPSIILKTNPGTAFIGPIVYTSEYRIAFEIPTYLYYGVQVSVSYLGENIFMELAEKDTTTIYGLPAHPYDLVARGFRLQFTYKRYIFQKLFGYAPYGLYLALHYSFAKAYITYRQLSLYNEYLFAVHENYDLLAGYQFKIYHFTLDMFTGLGYKNNFWAIKSSGKTEEVEGIYLKIPIKFVIGFNIGYEF
jgi:hypothetical protein